jgi:glycosyltransferase involved in cell wall biosynthesis
MENRRKIVYLLPGGLFNSGGMERAITIKANYLAEVSNYDVSIVTTEQMGRPVFYPLSEKVRLYHLDIGIHENFGKESYLRKCISRYLKTKEYKKKLVKLLDKIRPDFTISTLGGLDIEFINDLNDGSIKLGELHFPGNFRQLMARKISDAWLPNVVARFRTREFKKKCERLSHLIVLTREEKLLWKNQQHVSVIPNPISFFSQEPAALTNKKAIAVGRLAYEKGFDCLIKAWKNVAAKHPDWELAIFGKGDQKSQLIRQIEENHLEATIKIHEPVHNIQERYMESSLFILPSRYLEALPMVLLEATSCGLPLVAFDAPCGPKDIITGGVNGFLIETGDISTLAEKINFLIESEEIRKNMGKEAKSMALNYREDPIMESWIHLLDELKNENNRSIGN